MMDSGWELHIDLSSECMKTVNNDQQFSVVGVEGCSEIIWKGV